MYVRTVKVRSSSGVLNEFVRVVEAYPEHGKVKQRVIADLGRKDVLAMRPIWHRAAPRVRAHIFVAALALLLSRLLERRLQEAGVDLSASEAIQAVSTIRVVDFRLSGQPGTHGTRRGVSTGSPRARQVLKALGATELTPPSAPSGEPTVT